MEPERCNHVMARTTRSRPWTSEAITSIRSTAPVGATTNAKTHSAGALLPAQGKHAQLDEAWQRRAAILAASTTR